MPSTPTDTRVVCPVGVTDEVVVPVPVPVLCVVGADGSLTGYAGGTDRKIRLLRLEGADLPGPDLAQDGIPGL